ncbi:MAG: hypothetical protein K1X64_01530 [Myxococcaceae bacterium]|nr:hypothetical protein [Myxococcaceae bacterium]
MTASSLERRQARRAEAVRRLMAMAPKYRADAMLEEVDGKALVRALPAEDVYSTILDIGLVDSVELVQLATPAQFRTFVDLAAWSRDRIDPIEVLHWLRAARGDDEDDFAAKVKSLDIEVLELIFKKLTVFHDLEEDPDANPDGVVIETPEGKFLIELGIEGPDQAALQQLTRDLIAQNPFELSRFIEAVRWELVSELEETAFQFRSARLADMGFPSLDEAMKLFAWVDPAKYAGGLSESVALAAATPVDFVEAAFKGLDSGERESLEEQVRYVVNSALVAEGAEPGDPKAIRSLSEQARDYLNLGLEHLSQKDPSKAPEVVRTESLKLIFQIGFSFTLKLKRHVERMAQEAGFKFAEAWLVLDEEAAFITALLRKRPLKALKVPGADPVPFRCRRELAEAEATLERVRLQRGVFQAVLGSTPAETVGRFGLPLSKLRPARLWNAVVAWAVVDGTFKAAPFAEDRVAALCDRVIDGAVLAPRVKDEAVGAALAALSFLAPHAAAELKVMVERALSVLAKELGPTFLKDGVVDVKTLESLPIEGQLTL